jgi:GT2 family glycosyltransferase
MKIGFVCTNYNNSSFTRAAIESLHVGGRGSDIRVVVVDNRSHEDDVAALVSMAREFPGVDILLNPENVGYFPGLNAGIHRLRRTWPEITHLAVGNNDLVFSPDFVETVERRRQVLDTWAVVSPDLVTPDGIHQNPHVFYPIGRMRKVAWGLYYRSYPVGMAIKRVASTFRRFTAREENDPESKLYQSSGPIEQGYGACYLLGPAFFRNFDRLFAPTFMMQEEFFLGEQLALIGQRTFYDPEFIVQHHGHATTYRLPSRQQWFMARDAYSVYKAYLRMEPEARKRMVSGGCRPAS